MARRFRVPDFARAALVAGLAFWPLIAAAQDVPAIPEQVLTNDPSHTTVDFGLSHLGFSTYRGSFGDVAIKLTLDTAHPEAAKLDAVEADGGSVGFAHELGIGGRRRPIGAATGPKGLRLSTKRATTPISATGAASGCVIRYPSVHRPCSTVVK